MGSTCCPLSSRQYKSCPRVTGPTTGMALRAGYTRHSSVELPLSVIASSTTEALPMPHWVVLSVVFSMTTAAARCSGYSSCCPVSGSAGAVLSAGAAAVLPQLPSSTAHSTAAPRRRLHLRFMGFSPY